VIPLVVASGRTRQLPSGQELTGIAWKNAVANFAALPAVSNVTGDTRITLDTLTEYTWDGSRWQPSSLLDLTHGSQDYDDFEADVLASDLNWSNSVTGTAAAATVVSTNVDTNHFGVRQLSTGTTLSGRVGLYTSIGSRQIGGSQFFTEALIRFPTLSTITERYSFRFGIGNFWNTSTLTPVNGIYFEYDDAVSLNWRSVNHNGALLTAQTSTVAVLAGAWIRLGLLYVDAPTAQSSFFINGVQAGAAITTNLPNATALGFGFRILKSIGTTARTALLDYFLQRTRLTVAR
jgi:hypothetical protein